MHKLWVIAHREYVAMVGTKAFVFTLVMMPILMFGSLLVMPLVNQVSSGKNRKIVIADATGKLFQPIARAASLRNEAIEQLAAPEPSESSGPPSKAANRTGFMGQASDTWEFSEAQAPLTDQQRLELSERLRSGELYAFVELPDGLLDLPTERTKAEANEQGQAPQAVSIPKFYSQDALINEVRGWLGVVINQEARLTRLKQAGLDNLDPRVFAKIDAKIELAPTLPMQSSDKGKSGNTSAMDSLIAMFLPFGVMMLMFMVILMAAQPMLESAMEEKNLRISELLLGSVTPAQLMGGKLLGNVAGSLIIFVLYGSGGLFLLNSQGLTDKLPVSVLPWFLLFQLLGVLFFSSIFLTVGASVNELKEAQSLLLPVWMVLMMPMMVWLIAIRDPNGPVATTLSFFPPSCPMMMVLRLASGTTVPYWQPPLAALIMVASTYLIVRTAGHIYRAGLLRNEGVRSITQLFRRSFSS
jgi:ABC-2 type transport system permease protein